MRLLNNSRRFASSGIDGSATLGRVIVRTVRTVRTVYVQYVSTDGQLVSVRTAVRPAVRTVRTVRTVRQSVRLV